MKTLIFIGMLVAVIDLVCTFYGKPLIRPGPIAKAMFPGLAKKPCTHPNLVSHKWLDDNTPMMSANCPDCGFNDCGHVYADPETWLND